MKQIPLTQGKFALIDDEDFEYLSQFKWHFTGFGYARRNGKMIKRIKASGVSMHREIMKISDKNIHVDHINHNKLDNRKSNLRLCTNAQNCKNRKIREGFSSKYKGVRYFKRDGNWMVAIKSNYKSIYLGYYDTEEEAAKVYDLAALKYHGEYAKLNLACSAICV